MRAEASKILVTRAASPTLTQTSIRNTSVGRDNRAVRLIDTIFGLLPAVYGDPKARQAYENESQRDVVNLSESWISKQFYTSHFCPVEICRDNGGSSVTIDDFINEICTFGVSEQRNNLFFLQSNIGSGKTALINHIITKYGNDFFHNRGLWFIRLNVDVMRHLDQENHVGFFRSLEEKIFTVLTKIVERHSSDLNSDTSSYIMRLIERRNSSEYPQDENALLAHIKESLLSVSKIFGRRLLLIIDNMDYIVHERDRFQFLTNKQEIDKGHIILIRKIVGAFYLPGSILSDIGANVIFMVRPDTYHLIKTTNVLVPMARTPFADNRYLFTLKGPSWDDVVTERTSLLERCISEISPNGVADEIRRHTDPLVRSLRDISARERLFRHLKAISVYGLRGVLSFFSDYTWYPANNAEDEAIVTTRFLSSYQLGLIAFMLNNRIIYSQNEANFPNLYYSNITADEEDEQISASSRIGGPRNVSRDHWATYWLKRLLLEYIRVRNDSGASLRPEEVYDVFCDTDEGLSFTEDMVRLCLGSFSQTHVSDLLEVARGLTGDKNAIRIENISLTERARHCLDEIFDTFPYLQLVVDDYLMPLPKMWINSFAITSAHTYKYLTAPHTDFMENAKSMVTFKAIRVARFLAMLAEAIEAEKATKPVLFERLREEGVKIPSAVEIFGRVMHELEALSSSGGGLEINLEGVRRAFTDGRAEVKIDIRRAYGLVAH